MEQPPARPGAGLLLELRGPEPPKRPRFAPADPILVHLLGSRLRARLLTALLEDSDRRLWFRELGRMTGGSFGFVHGELEELRDLGLVSDAYEGGARFFVVNATHPLCTPLRALLISCEATHEWLKLPIEKRPPRRIMSHYKLPPGEPPLEEYDPGYGTPEWDAER